MRPKTRHQLLHEGEMLNRRIRQNKQTPTFPYGVHRTASKWVRDREGKCYDTSEPTNFKGEPRR